MRLQLISLQSFVRTRDENESLSYDVFDARCRQSHQRKSSGKIASRYRMLLHEKREDPKSADGLEELLSAVVELQVLVSARER
jgi:hypothetical protein